MSAAILQILAEPAKTLAQSRDRDAAIRTVLASNPQPTATRTTPAVTLPTAPAVPALSPEQALHRFRFELHAEERKQFFANPANRALLIQGKAALTGADRTAAAFAIVHAEKEAAKK